MDCALKKKNITCECMVISRPGLTVTPSTLYLACDLYDTQTGKCILDEALKRQCMLNIDTVNDEYTEEDEDFLLYPPDDEHY